MTQEERNSKHQQQQKQQQGKQGQRRRQRKQKKTKKKQEKKKNKQKKRYIFDGTVAPGYESVEKLFRQHFIDGAQNCAQLCAHVKGTTGSHGYKGESE